MQDAASAESIASSAAYHACACTLAALSALPSPVTPPGAARACLLPLAALYPHCSFLSAHLHSLYKRMHQLSRLRIDLARITAATPAGSSVQFTLGYAAATSAHGSGHSHTRGVLENALQGVPLLRSALCAARRRTCGHTAEAALRGTCSEIFCDVLSGVELLPGQLDSSPVLWLAYLQWLVSTGAHSAARDVFVRAVFACPWSKGLWLRGLCLIAEVLQPADAEKYLKVMTDECGLQLSTLPAEVLFERLEA